MTQDSAAWYFEALLSKYEGCFDIKTISYNVNIKRRVLELSLCLESGEEEDCVITLGGLRESPAKIPALLDSLIATYFDCQAARRPYVYTTTEPIYKRVCP